MTAALLRASWALVARKDYRHRPGLERASGGAIEAPVLWAVNAQSIRRARYYWVMEEPEGGTRS